MTTTRTARRAGLALVMTGLALTAAACRDDASPPILIEGGGFIFNYRIAEVYYGVSVKPLRKFPAGASLVGLFDDPAGGPPLIVRQPITGDRLAYALSTPPVTGVKTGRDYHVVVRVEGPDGGELARAEETIRSELDQDVNPEKPLTIGPLYTPNPEARRP